MKLFAILFSVFTKKYFRLLTKSFYDPLIYREILRQTLQLSFKHFLASYLLLSLATAAFLSTLVAPQIIDAATTNLSTFKKAYPESLTVTITKESMSATGAELPLSIPTSEHTSPTTNFITIDEAATAEDITKIDTLVLLTSKAMAINLDPQKQFTRIIPWKNLEIETTITKTEVTTQIDQLTHIIESFKKYLFITILIASYISFTLTRLIYVFIYGLFISSLGALIKRPYPFKNYLNISLYTIVVTETISIIQRLIYHNTSPNVFTIIFLGSSIIATLSLPKAIRIKYSK